MMKKIVASDHDGSFETHPEIRDQVDFLITGRAWNDREGMITRGLPVFFNPTSEKPTLDQVIMHKASIINRTGVSVYYENQPDQVKVLRVMCPKCKVVQL